MAEAEARPEKPQLAEGETLHVELPPVSDLDPERYVVFQ